jgi:uroporphyrinogen decarboxylase
MHPRDRVKNTIGHKEPDKVPAHVNATKWVVKKLKHALGVDTDRDLLKALHIDVYDMRGIDLVTGTVPRYTGPANEFFTENWGGNIHSFWRIREFENKTPAGWTIDKESPPLSDATDIMECEKYIWPSPDWFDFSVLPDRLHEWSEFSILSTGGSIFQHPTFLRGLDTLMVDMASDPGMACYFMDKFTDFYLEYYSRIFQEAGEKIDVFAVADDFGMQNTLLISPGMFDEFAAPRLKKLIDLAHGNDIFFLLHTCGNIKELIPRFIELGVDILDPVQPESLDPLEIKKEFGREICLRGGISVQHTLTHGSVEDVEKETKRIIDNLAPGGGYILAPGHPVLQDDIPVENIITMYKTAYEHGFY